MAKKPKTETEKESELIIRRLFTKALKPFNVGKSEPVDEIDEMHPPTCKFCGSTMSIVVSAHEKKTIGVAECLLCGFKLAGRTFKPARGRLLKLFKKDP